MVKHAGNVAAGGWYAMAPCPNAQYASDTDAIVYTTNIAGHA
jgi:hypothetical protein